MVSCDFSVTNCVFVLCTKKKILEIQSLKKNHTNYFTKCIVESAYLWLIVILVFVHPFKHFFMDAFVLDFIFCFDLWTWKDEKKKQCFDWETIRTQVIQVDKVSFTPVENIA